MRKVKACNTHANPDKIRNVRAHMIRKERAPASDIYHQNVDLWSKLGTGQLW